MAIVSSHEADGLEVVNFHMVDDLLRALHHFKPSDFVGLDTAVETFQEFFQRGTREQCLQFIPAIYQPRNTKRNRPDEFLSGAKVVELDRSAARFFEGKKLKGKGLDRLVRATVPFSWGKIALKDKLTTIWGAQDPIFVSESSCPRTKLFQGLDRSKTDGELARIRTRALLLLGSHEVEQLRGWVKNHEKLQKGQDALSKTLDIIAGESKVGKDTIKGWYERKKVYFELAERRGIGSLLETGAASRDLEKLSIDDTQLLCDYWDQGAEAPSQNPGHLADTDHLAVVTVVEGMRAYGCRLEELPTSSSRLAGLLRKYVSLEALAKGNIQFLDKPETQFCEWQPNKRPRLQATDRQLFTPETARSDGAPLPGMSQLTDTQQGLVIASETLNMVGDSPGNENGRLQLGDYLVTEEADCEWQQRWWGGIDPLLLLGDQSNIRDISNEGDI